MKKYMHFSKRVMATVLRCIPIIRMHYRLGRRIYCVTEACNLIGENQGEIGSRPPNRTLERRLTWRGINFSQLPAHNKANLHRLFSDQPLQPHRYEELKKQILEAPVELLPCRQWLILHEMSCFRGIYTLAQIFREKARRLAVRPLDGKEFKPPINWENTIGAVIEGGECHRSDHLNQLLVRAGITGDVASKWHIYLAVLNGQKISRELAKRFDGSDFVDYLVGKSIAIVGPAPTEALDAEEIDSHDLVVRLNHSFEGKGTDPKHKGMRTDITYFNEEQANALINERGAILPNEVTWGCFESNRRESRVKGKSRSKKRRVHIRFSEAQFHGAYNMMPIVALDCALFGAKSIKIYHTDLMLSVVRQKGYFPASFNRPDDIASMQEHFRNASIVHDPIQQYRTLNSLWRNKKITGDARFVEVMEMDLDAYLSELERVYASRHAQLGPSNASPLKDTQSTGHTEDTCDFRWQ